MVLQFFANILRIENDQRLKFEHVAVFEHVKSSNGSDNHLGFHNLNKKGKTQVQNHVEYLSF